MVRASNFTLQRVRAANMRSDDQGVASFVTFANNDYDGKIRFCTFLRNDVRGILVGLRSPDTNRASNHEVRSCYFGGVGPRDNGNECLKLGSDGGRGGNRLLFSIFENYDAEVEIISVKSSDNVIRRCVFTNCYGSVSLRGGHRNRVEECYFTYSKYNDRSTFLEIWGDGHTITNNYFYSVASLGERSWTKNSGIISLMSGNTRSLSITSFESAEKVTVARNIVGYAKSESPALGIGVNIGLNGRFYPSRDCTVRDNYFYGTYRSTYRQIDADDNSVSSFTFSGNRAWPVPGLNVRGISKTPATIQRDSARANLPFPSGQPNVGPQYAPVTNKGAPF